MGVRRTTREANVSQCHDPYDTIEGPTVKDIAGGRTTSAAQCHDSYDTVGLTTAVAPATAAKTAAVERNTTEAKTAAVERNRPRPRRRIVVGVDGSEASKDALRWAARQAQLTGSSLEAVMTWEIAATTSYPVPVPNEYDPSSNAKDALNETVHSVLGQPDGFELVPTIVQGPAARRLVQEAKGADLLVVGSRGHGPLVGVLLGSVSEHCMTHAPCPVVVVHKSHHAA
jgi:nucleotide-binding universal stress UspA family protein